MIFCAVGVCLIVSTTSCSQKPKVLGHDGKPLRHHADGRIAQTHHEFLSNPAYKATRDIWYHDARLAEAETGTKKIILNLSTQRGNLLVNNRIAMDFPICTGKDGNKTPRGTFSIGQKKELHISTSYGGVYDASDNCIDGDATPRSRVPAGCHYAGAEMPYWMRINGAIGMHVGRVYREASSHGCIRIPVEACRIVYDKCPSGTSVTVKD